MGIRLNTPTKRSVPRQAIIKHAKISSGRFLRRVSLSVSSSPSSNAVRLPEKYAITSKIVKACWRVKKIKQHELRDKK